VLLGRILTCLTFAVTMSLPVSSIAALRVPQVPIAGTGLQDFLDAQGESIRADQDQQTADSISAPACYDGRGFSMQVELMAKVPGVSLGVYDVSDPTWPSVEVFPTGARQGWFAVVVYRLDPIRVEVILFDEAANLLARFTTPGGNRHAIGFFVDSPAGRGWSEDAKNRGGEPRFLWYAGTGINSGCWWIAAEDTPRADGGDGDFDDVILFVDQVGCGDPVQRATWSGLKARFR